MSPYADYPIMVAEVERLTLVLHRLQQHPDFEYRVTFRGNTAHKPLDGWEPNPARPDVSRPNGRNEQFWMRRTP